MKRFAALFAQLDQTNKTNDKVALIKSYFSHAPDKDQLWTLAFFTHKRPRRNVKSSLLRQWAAELAEIPDWLLDESYHSVGDVAETISLVLPPSPYAQDQSLAYWIDYLQTLGSLDDNGKKERVVSAWQQMTPPEIFVFTKLMTSSFRIGVSQNLVTRAVAEVYELDKTVVAHRLMGKWKPDETTFEDLILKENQGDHLSRPYPFFLAHPTDTDVVPTLGPVNEWQVEWKWDGIRSQVVVRDGQLAIWSRGEDLITDKFPEFTPFGEILPDGTVVDGEILPFINDQPLPFATLQTRIGRKNVTKSILKSAPVILMAYDLLEWEGQDIRTAPLSERRALLETLHQQYDDFPIFRLSTLVEATDWEALKQLRERSREHYAEGFMLKRKSSPYRVGRKRGDWWKWKVEPLTIDGVLINAMRGSGRRAGLFTDYTFAVWDDRDGQRQLVPFTKAYSGLTDQEIRQVDNFVKRNTQEKFGPVRSVTPQLVFEIGFEGIQRSTRHKSGVALRFPRILRWRQDKKADEANTLAELQELLEVYG